MRLFIAEKPELAQAIASGIDGAYQKFNGYLKKGENIITWGFGHVLALATPDYYDERYKKWNLEDLPLKIDKFAYIPIPDKKKQLKIICDLIKDSKISAIVNCGDADEEGQILIDEIIDYSKTKKPVFRLLLQDLTEKGVRAQLKNLRSNNEFKGLSASGFARSQADWITGINLTRAYTKKAQIHGFEGVLSVGRVQTPILGLVVARDLEHESHKISFYYSIRGKFLIENNEIYANYKTNEKILDENIAKDIKTQCEGKKFDLQATNEEKLEFAPLPYNLLELQSECSRKFGFKPDRTLEITQILREKHKLISYNRSDCQYLPENLYEQSPEILASIKAVFSSAAFDELIDNADTNIKSQAFNDKFITAHYGIIPTSGTKAKISDLSKETADVFELIAKRFIAQFYPPREYIHTSLDISNANHHFTASSNKTTKDGFMVVYTKDEFQAIKKEVDDENLNDVDISTLKTGEDTKCLNVSVEKKQTKPRSYYTMSSLLDDLKAISKYVKDERIKNLLREKDKDKKGENGGIGTPATRSEHIKKLFEREYIEEKGKSIISTKKGRDLIALAPKILSSPDMTALWFEQQKEISAGSMSKEDFLNQVFMVVKREIDAIKGNDSIASIASAQNDYPCKACGVGHMVRLPSKKRPGAFWWGCTNFAAGCKQTYFDKDGKPDGYDEPAKNQAASKQNMQNSNIVCPVCKRGYLIRRASKKQKNAFWWGCSEWQSGCKAAYYDDNGKPKI